MAVFAFALELNANQISPFFVRSLFYRHVNKTRQAAENELTRRGLKYCHRTKIGIQNRHDPSP
jgi:hypothetical protein